MIEPVTAMITMPTSSGWPMPPTQAQAWVSESIARTGASTSSGVRSIGVRVPITPAPSW